MTALTDWFSTPTLAEGTIDDLQFAMAIELIDPPQRREMVSLLRSSGWKRVHRTNGYVYVHPSHLGHDPGAIYSSICRALVAEVAAAQLAGDHVLELKDLRKRVAVRSGLYGRMERSDFEVKADRALEAMRKRFEGWGYERGADKLLRFTYRPTGEQLARHVAAGLTLQHTEVS